LTLFGRTICSPAPDLRGLLSDVSSSPAASDQGGVLPFDVNEVVHNLRLERYQPSLRAPSSRLNGWARDAYYAARPLMPDMVRQKLQRRYFRDWSQIQFPAWPVDDTVDRLMKLALIAGLKARGLSKIPFIWFWPSHYRAAAVLTHDVETSTGFRSCNRLMDLDDSFGVKSSFQIVPEKRYEPTLSVIQDMKGRGFEVNVQDLNHDGLLYRDYSEFRARAVRINEYRRSFGAEGFRSGVLYRNVDWYDALEFSYDMSMPNVGHLEAQRGGCCTIMPYFIGNILEIPLTTAQDYSLFYILKERSIDLWKRQTDKIVRGNGMASFISHPDYLFANGNRELYQELLTFLCSLRSDQAVWMTTPGNMNEWCRQRRNLKLVFKEGAWRTEGPGSDRATVAFAVQTEGGIAYEFSTSRL